MTVTLGPTSHTYFSQRLRLHYTDWGNPDAPPMILIHGGRDHCRNWDWVAEHGFGTLCAWAKAVALPATGVVGAGRSDTHMKLKFNSPMKLTSNWHNIYQH